MKSPSHRAWPKHPAALSALSLLALAGLLSGGLAVARAVNGTPVSDTSASASPSAAPAGGTGNGTDNVAAGVNGTDGKTFYAIRLKIVQTANDTVDTSNAAAAVNDGCTDCSTVAIAFEGVLVAGSPSTFDPTNLALAANIDCSGCTAFADAYQQVVQRSTRVRITGAGRRQVADIRRDLEMLRHETLTLDEIRARVKADEQAFADVLRNDCVPIGHDTSPAAGADVSDSPSDMPTEPPATSPTATPVTPQSPASTPTARTSPSSTPTP